MMQSRSTSRSPPCRSAVAELGDLHADIDDTVFAIDELLEWAARDARSGTPEVPEPDGPED